MTKILLVEDDPLNRDCLARLLAKRGFEVVCAEDGETAIGLAQSASPQVILMDINLPGLDGYQATRALRDQGATRAIPVIALTAHALPRDREEALAAGCAGFETKPVDLAHLLGTIQGLLGAGPAS